MGSLRPYFTQRRWLLGSAAVLGLAVRAALPAPPDPTLEDLASALSRATSGAVSPDAIVWEPSPGYLSETFFGRPVLFLSAPAAGQPRDLYRARVRVTLQGQPLSIERVRNLTATPIGDEAGLKMRGDAAVFATVAYGRIQGISVLDTRGIREADRPASLFDRALLAISSYQQTGSFVGLGRTDITLDVPARQAKLVLDGERLQIDLGEQGRELVYDLSERTLRGLEGAQAYAARSVPQVHPPKPLVLWAVDTVRAEVGPGPIAWLENRVFGARDKVKRTTYALFSNTDDALKQGDEEVAASVLGAAKLSSAEESWPPPPIPSLWKSPKPGEGEWRPVLLPFLKPLPGVVTDAETKPPAYFYSTFIRPDEKRPYSEVHLIAMDMRQLELGMQAGYEDPKPLTGPPGGGRLPDEPEVLDRVVATFNGAFKTTHGEYGMMVAGRVLLPPVPEAASIVVTKSGEVGLGSWPKSKQIPAEIASYRQNLDPLVDDGVANPRGRFVWGWQLEGTSVLTQRTALCVTNAGHLYYAFAEETDGPTLGKALRQAGCSYAVHLDMNPAHCGFAYTDIVDYKKNELNLQLAHPEMKIRPDKFVRWSAKDFFYVMLRDPVPHDASGARWVPDGGQQPPPQWLPGIFSGNLKVGTDEIELVSFERGRVDFALRGGSREPTPTGAPPLDLNLSGDDAQRVLAAIGLGHSTSASRYGLQLGERPTLELQAGYATLVVRGSDVPVIHPPGQRVALAPGEAAAQLPLLAEGGALTPRAREHGAMRTRGALCVTSSGRTIVGRSRQDSSAALTAALLKVGCKRVVELDRGSHHPAFVHRTGTSTPPVAGYEASVLYALGRPMLPHAKPWKPKAPPAETRTAGYDPQREER